MAAIRRHAKESLRDLYMRRGVIDRQARGQTFCGVGDKRPQRHRITRLNSRIAASRSWLMPMKVALIVTRTPIRSGPAVDRSHRSLGGDATPSLHAARVRHFRQVRIWPPIPGRPCDNPRSCRRLRSDCARSPAQPRGGRPGWRWSPSRFRFTGSS